MAVVSLACLMVTFLVMRANLVKEDQQLALNMSALSWKVSETLFESQRLEGALLAFETGRLSRENLILAVEMFWGSVEVLRVSEVRNHPRVVDLVEGMLTSLERIEQPFYHATYLGPERTGGFSKELKLFSEQLRGMWIREFLGNRDAIVHAVTEARGTARMMYEYLIAGCICLLGIYLVAELMRANSAHASERELREAAMSANAAKTAFLANVSHEVRTPLNGVLGMAQELAESDLTEDQRQMVNVICSSGELLLATINDVLSLSKIEAGGLELECHPFDLEARVRQCIDLHGPALRDKMLRLSIKVDPDLPERVVGDPMRFSQVLNNLLSNAIKFTERGEVAVTLRAAPAAKDRQLRLWLSVRDTGIGISPEAQSRIFSPFTQAESDTSRKFGGTGLGLTISKNICGLMGGDLTAVSVPGEGSTFTAEILLALADDAPCATPADPAEVPAAALRIASGTGDRHGVRADIMAEPTAGVGIGAQAPPDRSDMPPFPAQRFAPPTLGLRVLIVDDGDTNRQILRRFLKHPERQIVEAESGLRAVDLARSERFDLILMDIQMPGMDGLQATARIRENEAQAHQPAVPIIAVTANVLDHQISGYLEKGIDHVIAKPVRKSEILDLMALYSDNQAA